MLQTAKTFVFGKTATAAGFMRSVPQSLKNCFRYGPSLTLLLFRDLRLDFMRKLRFISGTRRPPGGLLTVYFPASSRAFCSEGAMTSASRQLKSIASSV